MRLLPLWLLIVGLALVCAGSDSDSNSDESKEKHRLKKIERHHHNRHSHGNHHKHDHHGYHDNHPAYPHPYGFVGREGLHEAGHNPLRMNSPPPYFPHPQPPVPPTYMFYPPHGYMNEYRPYLMANQPLPAFLVRPGTLPNGYPAPPSASSSPLATSSVNQQPPAADATPDQATNPSSMYNICHYPLPCFPWKTGASSAPIGYSQLPSSSSSSSATSVINQQPATIDSTPAQASSPSASATSNSAVTINQGTASVVTEAPHPAESHNPEQEQQPLKQTRADEHVKALVEPDSKPPSTEAPACGINEICYK